MRCCSTTPQGADSRSPGCCRCRPDGRSRSSRQSNRVSQNDLKKPNEKLKNHLEGELQPQIEKLKQNKNKINLSPKEIQKMKDENVKKDDIITFFQKKLVT